MTSKLKGLPLMASAIVLSLVFSGCSSNNSGNNTSSAEGNTGTKVDL
ncbi:MAG TPA: hypothetical protein VGN87_05745 [Paenibacillus sp.]|jgi:putative aldouronate transport system substrate-binding protein